MLKPLTVAVWMLALLFVGNRSAATLAAETTHMRATTTSSSCSSKGVAVVVGSVRRLQNHASVVPSGSCFVQSSNIVLHGRSARKIFFKAPPASSSSSSPPCYYNRHRRLPDVVGRRLFFRATDNSNRPKKVAPPDWVLQQLKSRDISIPFTFPVVEDGDDDVKKKKNTMSSTTLTVRCMTKEDFATIVPMCIAEFGTGPTASLADFPWRDPTDPKLTDWWDRFYFEPMVTMALKAKLQSNRNRGRGRRPPPLSLLLSPPPPPVFGDPTVLVLTRQDKDEHHNDDSPPVVVGMVELSKQAPESTKNPPAFPMPLWFKQLYCQLTGMPLEGWVTNLLIGEKYRGLGYSKICMAATEGIAKSWNVGSIYLHADADRSSGKVPQSLYEGLGYEVVVTDHPQFKWMGRDFNYRVHMVEGVPLLFLRKRLK